MGYARLNCLIAVGVDVDAALRAGKGSRAYKFAESMLHGAFGDVAFS
jgi:hypothetical protein